MRADKTTGRILVDARQIAAQTKLTTTAVTTAIEAITEEHLIESDKGLFTKIPCSYVTLIETLEPSRLPIPDRYR